MTRIVIGVDPSARSEDAIVLGGRLARAGGAEVVVAAITSSEHPHRDEAHLTVRRMSGLLVGLEPERIRTGVIAAPSPAHGLHDLAVDEASALVVLGSTHTGPLGRVRPGSTGERLLSGAPCAVAVAPHGYRTWPERPPTRIGVAWDGSPEARAALAAAVAAARAFDAPLEIITVVSTTLPGTPAVMSGPSYGTVLEDVTREVKGDLARTVAETSELVEAHGVLLKGRAWRELADRSAHLDLLFAGSRGYGPAHAVLAGGTTGPLTQHAHCPVIVLPRGVQTPLADLFEPAAASA